MFLSFLFIFTQLQVVVYCFRGSVPYEFIIFILNHQNIQFQFPNVLPLLMERGAEFGSSNLFVTRDIVAKELNNGTKVI